MSYLFCPECQNRYKTLEHCPECDIPLLPPTAPQLRQHIDGDGNSAIQIGGDHQGDITINQPSPQERPIALIQRETITPLTVAGIPVKNWWLFISAAIPLLANLLSIINFWLKLPTVTSTHNDYGNLLMYGMMIGALLLITAAILQRGRYITLPFGRTVERDKDGNLYLTRIGGTCGLCGAPVRVKTVGPKEYRQTRVICTENPDQHWAEFDRTKLGDVGEEYRNRQ
jgi:hypothetical protein